MKSVVQSVILLGSLTLISSVLANPAIAGDEDFRSAFQGRLNLDGGTVVGSDYGVAFSTEIRDSNVRPTIQITPFSRNIYGVGVTYQNGSVTSSILSRFTGDFFYTGLDGTFSYQDGDATLTGSAKFGTDNSLTELSLDYQNELPDVAPLTVGFGISYVPPANKWRLKTRTTFKGLSVESSTEWEDNPFNNPTGGTTTFTPGGLGITTTTLSGQTLSVTAESVPEPLTMLGAATAVGFGTAFKRRLAKATKENKNS